MGVAREEDRCYDDGMLEDAIAGLAKRASASMKVAAAVESPVKRPQPAAKVPAQVPVKRPAVKKETYYDQVAREAREAEKEELRLFGAHLNGNTPTARYAKEHGLKPYTAPGTIPVPPMRKKSTVNEDMWIAGGELAMAKVAMLKAAYGADDYKRDVNPAKTSVQKLTEAQKAIPQEYAQAKDDYDQKQKAFNDAQARRQQYYKDKIYSGEEGWKHPINTVMGATKRFFRQGALRHQDDAVNKAKQEAWDAYQKRQTMEDQAKANNINLKTGQQNQQKGRPTILSVRQYTTTHRTSPYASASKYNMQTPQQPQTSQQPQTAQQPQQSNTGLATSTQQTPGAGMATTMGAALPQFNTQSAQPQLGATPMMDSQGYKQVGGMWRNA